MFLKIIKILFLIIIPTVLYAEEANKKQNLPEVEHDEEEEDITELAEFASREKMLKVLRK